MALSLSGRLFLGGFIDRSRIHLAFGLGENIAPCVVVVVRHGARGFPDDDRQILICGQRSILRFIFSIFT